VVSPYISTEFFQHTQMKQKRERERERKKRNKNKKHSN